GTLDGWESKFSQRETQSQEEDIDISPCEIESDDKSIALINFRVTTSKYGLFRDKIVVTNKNNTGQVVEVEVRLFVDNNILGFWARGDSSASKNIVSEKALAIAENMK